MNIEKIAKEEVRKINNELIEIRRDFHMNPDLSYEEKRTSKKIMEYLDKWDIKYETNFYNNAIIATIGNNKTNKKIGFRADMDALPLVEKNNYEYKSKNEGIMHACGHDAHMTILLGLAKTLKNHEENLNGEVKLIFQPAEEASPTGGAQGILESGKIGDLDYIFGLHMWPFIKGGTFGILSGPIMASSDHFYINIRGESSHAAKPHLGIDSILIGSQVLQEIQSIVSRNIDVLSPAVITVGKITGGTRYNILANFCQLEGTVRTFNEDVRDYIEEKLGLILKSKEIEHGCKCELIYKRGYPVVVNDKEATDLIKSVAISSFEEKVVDDICEISTIAEDFSYYLKKYKGSFIWFGVDGNHEPLHSDTFDIDEENIWMGSYLFAKVAEKYLK
ncbi:M20 metallopeptidase family protein [Peptoniphilus grossensis]|uniref:M20 metallopeptidase family protein n=1 Tax=Peptoniphilus grossensis TaxID=1465756 RepID=UPI0002DCDB13|nr:amidohydrolase [Peptoniphilus grossensis]